MAAVLAYSGFIIAGELGGDFARNGGMRMMWAPPRGIEPARAVGELATHHTHVECGERECLIEVPNVRPYDAGELAQHMTGMRLEVREMVETAEMKDLPRVLNLPMKGQQPVDLDVAEWTADSGIKHADMFLRGERQAIADQLAFAAAAGWKLPPHTHIAYGRFLGFWRTYVVSDTVELDGTDVVDARISGKQPIVAATLTPKASEKLAELTTRLPGHRLAILFGDEVRANPVINEPIRDGVLMLQFGSTHERTLLIAQLKAGALPAGGSMHDGAYVPPSSDGFGSWPLPVSIIFGSGLACGLAAGLLARLGRRGVQS